MQTRTSTHVLLLLGWVVWTGLCVERLSAQSKSAAQRATKETSTGTIVGIGGALGGVSRPFTMEIDGVTSDADAERFAEILRTQGQDALLKAITKEKKGRFAVDGHVGHDLNTVRSHESPNGRRITAIFDRWEKMYGTRSLDYPFTYIELFVDNSGKGEGSLIAAAKIYFDKKNRNTVNIENFGIYPARLMGVQLRTK